MNEHAAIETANLSNKISTMINHYLSSVEESKVVDLYDMVMEQIEPPLFKAVLLHCKYNQSRAAQLLGISRGTCRTKLFKYFNEQYCGRREKS